MPKVLDLFSGAGGFSLGFKLEGFDVETHVEIDRYASDTLKKNFPNSKVITDDVRFLEPHNVINSSTVDVMIGGPPCQGFSVAGSTQFGVEDNRNELVFWYLKFVQTLNPKIAIIENVPNVLTKKSKEGTMFLDLIRQISSEMGYEVSYHVLNSVNFGVPQSRRRAFIVLHSKQVKFDFPQITHDERGEKLLFSSTKRFTTVGEALNDLPDVDAGQIGSGLPYKSEPSNDFQIYCRENSLGVLNHNPMKHTGRVIERFKIIQPGQSLKDVPLSHGQVAYETSEKVAKPFKYNNYRLDPNKPSLAIPASYQSLFVHPVKDRNLTAREGARLMSFPDWYEFEGPKTMMSWESGLSQYNQIGNAVCPMVARSLAGSVRKYLKELGSAVVNIESSGTLTSILKNSKKHRYTIEDAQKNAGCYQLITGTPSLDFTKSKYFDKERKLFVVKKIDVTMEKVKIAYDLLRKSDCAICNRHEPPYGNHLGSLNLLISKSDIQSLVGNGNDNGLDFHLRVITNDDYRYANEVALILEDLGVVNIVPLQNPRTGKMVKSIVCNV
jgi:DNA (cytosine-5)-methyltransferase 1